MCIRDRFSLSDEEWLFFLLTSWKLNPCVPEVKLLSNTLFSLKDFYTFLLFFFNLVMLPNTTHLLYLGCSLIYNIPSLTCFIWSLVFSFSKSSGHQPSEAWLTRMLTTLDYLRIYTNNIFNFSNHSRHPTSEVWFTHKLHILIHAPSTKAGSGRSRFVDDVNGCLLYTSDAADE